MREIWFTFCISVEGVSFVLTTRSWNPPSIYNEKKCMYIQSRVMGTWTSKTLHLVERGDLCERVEDVNACGISHEPALDLIVYLVPGMPGSSQA